MYLTIPLGTYGLEFAEIIRKKFNEQRNRYPERHPRRLNAHLLFRGRGKRNTYVKVQPEGLPIECQKFQRVCNNFDADLPVEYAQRVAVYLKIDLVKLLKSLPKYMLLPDDKTKE